MTLSEQVQGRLWLEAQCSECPLCSATKALSSPFPSSSPWEAHSCSLAVSMGWECSHH